jgi:hypothetical protein
VRWASSVAMTLAIPKSVITVNDLVPVGVIERFGDLARDVEGLIKGERWTGEKRLFERAARNKLHHDVTALRLLVLQGVMDGHDTGMRKAACRSGLAQENVFYAGKTGLARARQQEQFDCNQAADGRIGGLVHYPHGPAAQLFNNLVPADFLHAPSDEMRS